MAIGPTKFEYEVSGKKAVSDTFQFSVKQFRGENALRTFTLVASGTQCATADPSPEAMIEAWCHLNQEKISQLPQAGGTLQANLDEVRRK